MKNQTTNWYKCTSVKVTSQKNGKTLLDIMNGDKYKVENGWLFIKDCYVQTHHFPESLVEEFLVRH